MSRQAHLSAIARRAPQALGAATCGAVLAYFVLGATGPGVLVSIVSTFVVLLLALHLYVRHQEAQANLRGTQMEAMAREHRQAQQHLEDLKHIAFHDTLTGFPNRRRLQDLLHGALERTSAEESHEFSLMYLDFDGFKLINDTLGHRAGDEFLVRASRLLQQQLRAQDVVARLGGDEFAVLVEGHGCADYAVSLAKRMLKVLSHPMQIDGVLVRSTASIGITSSRIGYAEPAEVLRDADIAMYRAKSAGKARYALFDVSLRQQLTERQLLEGELRGALGRGEVNVEYQPIFDLGSRRLLGFEALLRWNHRELGHIDPRSCIPGARECGLVVELTDFVLGQACRQLRRFQQSLTEGDSLVMHVNVCGDELDATDFASRITGAVEAARLSPHHLVLELAKNTFIERGVEALPKLHELRALGFRLSMDEFGTGALPVPHLSKLPLSSLKINPGLVAHLEVEANAATVKSVVFLGRALGLSVIAEGIETQQQLVRLRALGCETGQGSSLTPAMPDEDLDSALRIPRVRSSPAPASTGARSEPRPLLQTTFAP